MTREHRLVLNLDDVTAVRWQCHTCGSAVSYQLDQSIRLPQTCQACNEPLITSGQFLADFHQMQAFVDALKATIRATRSKKVGATLKLELVDDPS